jgi:hypothetical protein
MEQQPTEKPGKGISLTSPIVLVGFGLAIVALLVIAVVAVAGVGLYLGKGVSDANADTEVRAFVEGVAEQARIEAEERTRTRSIDAFLQQEEFTRKFPGATLYVFPSSAPPIDFAAYGESFGNLISMRSSAAKLAAEYAKMDKHRGEIRELQGPLSHYRDALAAFNASKVLNSRYTDPYTKESLELDAVPQRDEGRRFFQARIGALEAAIFRLENAIQSMPGDPSLTHEQWLQQRPDVASDLRFYTEATSSRVGVYTTLMLEDHEPLAVFNLDEFGEAQIRLKEPGPYQLVLVGTPRRLVTIGNQGPSSRPHMLYFPEADTEGTDVTFTKDHIVAQDY